MIQAILRATAEENHLAKVPGTHGAISMATTDTLNTVRERFRAMTAEEKKVIMVSSNGTMYEWCDCFLYGALAAIIRA